MITFKSKLVLGTVQLGMKYGLANTTGQPDQKEAFAILDKALEGGIEIFDTAWAYGTAEDVVGAWIKARDYANRVKVISKMKPHVLNDYPDGTPATEIVRQEIEKSLKRLGLRQLEGYLLHSPQYVYLDHVIKGLKEIKKAGLVKNIGVSIYDEAEALQGVTLGLDFIQIPYNVFDQRLEATKFFELAKENKVTVFARSPFLQGLLLMQPSALPEHLNYLKPYLEKFMAIARKHHLTPEEASLQFALVACPADHIVFGVETLSQLSEDLEISQNDKLSPNHALIQEIKEAFKDLNKGAINPSLWSKVRA